MPNKTRLINSLAIAWPITDQSKSYAIHLLGQLGHRPTFPDCPQYCQLWAVVTAGKILRHNVSQWEADLAKEADRLEKIKSEYDKELNKSKAEIAAIQARRRALTAAADEVNEALGKRLGY